MSLEYVALAVAAVSGVLVPLAITAVFPWALAIDAKMAVIVEKLTALASRIEIEKDYKHRQQMSSSLFEHERKLDNHEFRTQSIESQDSRPA